MEEEHELIDGRLQLKKDAGGWRHCIEDGGEDHDIHCGSYMDVLLGRYEDQEDGRSCFRSGSFMAGRYEAYLGEPVKAYLVLGDFYPGAENARLTVPLGTRVRVKK